jgi:hypothetical protein
MAHFFGESYLCTNITEIICTFHEILLCPCLLKYLMVQKKTLWNEQHRRVQRISVAGTEMQQVGRSLHHPRSSLHCFTLLMNSKQADAALWC